MKYLLLSVTLSCALLAQEPFQVKVTVHGRPIILIPGLASGGATWDSTAAHYKDRYECHVLTVAGFAGVPRIPAPMLDRVRDGIADYIRMKKLDKPTIVGHSLGGFLALAVAVQFPDLPGRLVIVDSYPFLGGMLWRLRRSASKIACACASRSMTRPGMCRFLRCFCSLWWRMP